MVEGIGHFPTAAERLKRSRYKAALLVTALATVIPHSTARAGGVDASIFSDVNNTIPASECYGTRKFKDEKIGSFHSFISGGRVRINEDLPGGRLAQDVYLSQVSSPKINYEAKTYDADFVGVIIEHPATGELNERNTTIWEIKRTLDVNSQLTVVSSYFLSENIIQETCANTRVNPVIFQQPDTIGSGSR